MEANVTAWDTRVTAFVYDWFRKLDVHAPVEEILPLLWSQGLVMNLPEGTLEGLEAFCSWYHGVIGTFFDEVHDMKALAVEYTGLPSGPDIAVDPAWFRAHVRLVVKWESRRWRPPAARSQWSGFDAFQRWVLRINPGTNELVIETYTVDALEPLQGSAAL